MLLKTELYSQDDIFANKIVKAWTIYKNEEATKDDREVAQAFLIYAFDLSTSEDMNKKLIKYMTDFFENQAKNPEYIPRLSPKHLKLSPQEMDLQKTTKNKYSGNNTKIQELFKRQELLDVNDEDKIVDPYRISYFGPQRRARHRVHIYQGKFHQNGEVFDTRNNIAHGKKGFAAFTLNANGELSMFNHLNTADSIAHSSMNAGSPVVSAGEIKIENGELVAINTFSGHYRPNLFNIYRALEYFGNRGINISNAVILLFKEKDELNQLGIRTSTEVISDINKDVHQFQRIHARVLFNNIREDLQNALTSINSDIISYQSFSLKSLLISIKDFFSSSPLTHKRRTIASKISTYSDELMDMFTDNPIQNILLADKLIKKLKALIKDNNNLSLAEGKPVNSGRLHEKISSFLQQAQDIRALAEPSEDMLQKSKQVY